MSPGVGEVFPRGRYPRILDDGGLLERARFAALTGLRTANRAMPLLTKVNRGLQSIPEWMPEGHGVDATEVEEAELV